MEIMKQAFLVAALTYINETHFGYDLEFHIDEAVDVAVGHFLSKMDETTGALSCDPPSEGDPI